MILKTVSPIRNFTFYGSKFRRQPQNPYGDNETESKLFSLFFSVRISGKAYQIHIPYISDFLRRKLAFQTTQDGD